MNEQRNETQVRLLNAIDRDLIDANITLNLIERLTEQNDHPQTRAFSDEELKTLTRNCTHAIILNLTKTLEKPGDQTYNLESLINHVCHDDDKATLRDECHKIRGNKVSGKLVEYRHKIIAHRNIEYKDYYVIEDEFIECRDYLLRNKGKIEKLIGQIDDLQMKIKKSRTKKEFHYDGGAEIFKIEDVEKFRIAYTQKH